MATKSKNLLQEALKEIEKKLSKETIEYVYGAYSVMSMNVVYYKFTNLATMDDYMNLPANLRMQIFSKHNLSKVNFEMICLAVAIIEGCGKCINAHEEELRKNKISSIKIQTVARIAAIITAIANVMRVKY